MKTWVTVNKSLLELLGLASLISFTLVIITMAALSGGGLMYFYEPNIALMVAEVLLGGYGVVVGFYKILTV